MDRFEASKQVADLDTAETAYRRCLGLLPDCQAALAGLSTVLRHRYDLTGFPSYLDERLILSPAGGQGIDRRADRTRGGASRAE